MLYKLRRKYVLLTIYNLFLDRGYFTSIVPEFECVHPPQISGDLLRSLDSQALLYEKHSHSRNFAGLINSFSATKDLQTCYQLHSEIIKKGVTIDAYLGSSLVDMYAKCGVVSTASNVFDNLQDRNVVCWCALITCYASHGFSKEALMCFEHMQFEGIAPNAFIFSMSLKACSVNGDLNKGREIHSETIKLGFFGENEFLASALVDMYSKLGHVLEAVEVFNKLRVMNVVLWTALIVGLTDNGCNEEALYYYKKMENERLPANDVTLGSSLKASYYIRDIGSAQKVHQEIICKGFENMSVISNRLIDTYVKCGYFIDADDVFNKKLFPDAIAFTTLIAGYLEHDCSDEALHYFEKMQKKGVPPNVVTFVSSLRASKSIFMGREMYIDITKKGFEREVPVANSLIDMYVEFHSLLEAHYVFDQLDNQDVVTWTIVVAGYVKHGYNMEALHCSEQMQKHDVSRNAVTLLCTLKACNSVQYKASEIHTEIIMKGFDGDPFLGNALIDMYAKQGLFGEAELIFHFLSTRNVSSWNALIYGYCEYGLAGEALCCLKWMHDEGFVPDSITLACSVKACKSVEALGDGQVLHVEIAKRGLEGDIFIDNSLMDMYTKHGLFEDAEHVFNKLQFQDIASWNIMIEGYTNSGRIAEAFLFLEKLQDACVSMNALCFVTALKTCSDNVANLEGQQLHAEIVSKGLETDVCICNVLVNMYSCCGLLYEAKNIFDRIPDKDVVSWNAIIAGYAVVADTKLVFTMFKRMIADGIKPNSVTFISMISACSHAGLLDEGQIWFKDMAHMYGFNPTLNHYGCMVDLVGRAGQLTIALSMIENVPFQQENMLWHSILGACQKWSMVAYGRYAFEQSIALNPSNTAVFVSMLNIYMDHCEVE